MAIAGTELSKGIQEYALVWWYDDAKPQLLYPADGQKLAPGDETLLVAENLTGPYTLWLSYDDGANFTRLGTVNGNYEHVAFDIPKDAPLTANAVVRVVDAERQMAMSPSPFTIAPRVKNLALEQAECSLTGWKLTWESNPLATLGYEVLGAIQLQPNSNR